MLAVIFITRKYITLIIVFLGIVMLYGCSAFSGNRPVAVTETDRSQISEIHLFPIPLITHEIDGKPVKIYGVAFDGTMNDKERVPRNERESLVAHIYNQIKPQIEARYYSGPGTQKGYFRNLFDAATGDSSSHIAQKAKRDFFKQAAHWLKEEQDVEIRVFVVGFSRGAAIARHFMNLVEQNWQGWQEAVTGKQHPASTPYFYALFFDTVATGQEEKLILSLPASLDYLLHIVAQDEPRTLFRHVIDEEYIDPASPGVAHFSTNYFSISRLNLMELPGSHSDIGATYPKGIGSVYRDLAEQILYEMGLTPKNVWHSSSDPLTQGKHDSRGFIDIGTGTPAPNSRQSVNRQPIYRQAKLSKARHEDSIQRLNNMVMAKAGRPGSYIQTRESPGLTLEIKRENEAILVSACKSGSSAFTSTCDFQFLFIDGKRYLDGWYTDSRFPGKKAFATLRISGSIWEQLKEGESATLSYSRLGTDIVIFLNNHQIESLPKEDSKKIPCTPS